MAMTATTIATSITVLRRSRRRASAAAFYVLYILQERRDRATEQRLGDQHDKEGDAGAVIVAAK